MRESILNSEDSPGALLPFPWVIVLTGTLLLTIAYANWYTAGVFFKPVALAFGWDRGTLAGVYAMRAIVMAVFVMPLGYWADHYGPRKVMLPSFIILGASFLISAMVTSSWQFYLSQGILMGTGTAGSFVCVLSTIGKWPIKRRGLALGIASAGVGLSSVIFSPLAERMIQSPLGWRGATAVLGAITLVLALPACLPFKNPSGPQRTSVAGKDAKDGSLAIWHVIPEVMRSRTFLAIFIMFVLFYTACQMVVNHLVNYVTDIGMSTAIAALMMSVMGFASVAGRLAMGAVSDRIGTRFDSVTCSAVVALSLLLLMVKTPAMIWISVVLFGVGFGGAAPLIPALLGERFGTGRLATLMGVATSGALIGNALGPWLGGFTFDLTGGYLLALAISAFLAVLAIAIALWLPPPARHWQEEERDEIGWQGW